MSSTSPGPYPHVVVRAEEAERLDSIGHVLLADSSATSGALTSHRVELGRGANGAVPHLHTGSSELFYVLGGTFDLLVDNQVVTARAGDLVIVPPRTAHAFAAHRNETAEALVIATPGIERFDYFRHVVRRRAGREPAEILSGLQDRFDTHFVDSTAWDQARSAALASTADRHGH